MRYGRCGIDYTYDRLCLAVHLARNAVRMGQNTWDNGYVGFIHLELGQLESLKRTHWAKIRDDSRARPKARSAMHPPYPQPLPSRV